MGFLLFLISSLLKWAFAPICYIYGCIASLFKGEFNQYQTALAIAKDQYGNAIGQYLFNSCLVKRKNSIFPYRFGNIDETISSVIGKNKVQGTLTLAGKFLDFILGLIEKDHSVKSIDITEDSSING